MINATQPRAAQVRRRSVYADRLLEYPDFVFSEGRERHRRGRWREFFRSHIGPTFDDRVIYEIGCNDAELLVSIAAKHPSTGFMGIDWKCRAIHTAATRVAEVGLGNIAFLHGRAQDICPMFANGELNEVWVFHPEPCDRPRELPNRLLSKAFLLDVHAVLRDQDSMLVVKTDHREYFDWFESQVSGAPFEIASRSTDYWNDPDIRAQTSTRLFAGEPTFFERRFMEKRKPIAYLELKRRPTAYP